MKIVRKLGIAISLIVILSSVSLFTNAEYPVVSSRVEAAAIL